jgi:oligoribonuclease NrnB/cAMP/cGMP phosphodiesterase (DHH superfamily)
MDGSACAALFVAAGFDRNKIHFSFPAHEQVEEVVDTLLNKTNDDILLVDVSVSEAFAERVGASGRVEIIDHHKGALPLARFDWCEIERENQRSGAMMFYDWLMKQDDIYKDSVWQYRDFVKAVDDYDRWVHEIPESKTLATFHYVLGQRLFLDRFLKNPSLNLNEAERYAINLESEKKADFIERTKKDAFIRTFRLNDKDIRVGFVLSSTYQSELGHAMCQDLDLDIDVAAIVGLHKISLRSEKGGDEVDLSVIAKLNGGGGHTSAAGCSLSKVLDRDFLEMVADNLKWE